MAHGNPRIQICEKCNAYGLTPRFSENICPICKVETRSIEKAELRKRLNIMIHHDVPVSFGWRDAGLAIEKQ